MAGITLDDWASKKAAFGQMGLNILSPQLGDFNEDLRLLGIDAHRAAIRVQIAAQDVARFMA